MMRTNRLSIGVIIIILGVVILLGKLGVFTFVWNIFWPIFLLAPGLLLHLMYFTRALPAGVLVPGGILVTYSLMFFYCGIFGWSSMTYLWPGFLLGVAIGLYEYFLFSDVKPRGALIASLIVGTISIIMFGFTLMSTGAIYVIAIALILIGVFLIMRRPSTW